VSKTTNNIMQFIHASLHKIAASIERTGARHPSRDESAVQIESAIEIAQLNARLDQATGIADRALAECAALRGIVDGCIAAFSDGPPATRDTLVDRVRTLNDTATALQVSLTENVRRVQTTPVDPEQPKRRMYEAAIVRDRDLVLQAAQCGAISPDEANQHLAALAKAPTIEVDAQMFRGLVRAACGYERTGLERSSAPMRADGTLWDDEGRNALELARKLGLAPPRPEPSWRDQPLELTRAPQQQNGPTGLDSGAAVRDRDDADRFARILGRVRSVVGIPDMTSSENIPAYIEGAMAVLRSRAEQGDVARADLAAAEKRGKLAGSAHAVEVYAALDAAVREIEEHNASSSYVTPKETLAGWRRLANPTEQQVGAACSGSVEAR
jgi:hypothetical protein